MVNINALLKQLALGQGVCKSNINIQGPYFMKQVFFLISQISIHLHPCIFLEKINKFCLIFFKNTVTIRVLPHISRSFVGLAMMFLFSVVEYFIMLFVNLKHFQEQISFFWYLCVKQRLSSYSGLIRIIINLE